METSTLAHQRTVKRGRKPISDEKRRVMLAVRVSPVTISYLKGLQLPGGVGRTIDEVVKSFRYKRRKLTLG